MEEIRDVQKTGDKLSRFINTQGLHVDPFGENKMGSRLYARAERIVAAVYLLTNHIPQSESIRTLVRDLSTTLLSDIINLRNEMRSLESMKVQVFESNVRKLISLTRVLAVSGFVSFQNADIVTEALDELFVLFHAAERSPLAESTQLSREDLLGVRNKSASVVKDIKDIALIKDNFDSKEVDTVRTPPRERSFSSNAASVRSESILQTLRSHGELGIREIASNLPEYSEKMIQRELVDLVQSSKVKKTGLKRWSRYSIVG